MLAGIFSLERVFAFDSDISRAEMFARELSEELSIKVEAITDLKAAASQSDICVTCTPAKEYFLKKEYISPGTFIAAVGADNEEKQELEPALLKESKIVVDVLSQCATIGELHHALSAGLMSESDVHANLGQVVAGTRPARESAEETIIFDSTGTALQDVIATAAVFEKAQSQAFGHLLDFAL